MDSVVVFVLCTLVALVVILLMVTALFAYWLFGKGGRERDSLVASQGSPREWLEAGSYSIFIHQVLDGHLLLSDGEQRVVYIEVEYCNRSREQNQSCRRNQWILYARDGYTYEVTPALDGAYMYQGKPYFGSERFLNPGANARGWFAFRVPDSAQVGRLQFMTAFLGTKTVDITLENALEREAVS